MKSRMIVLPVSVLAVCLCFYAHGWAEVTFQDTVGDIYFPKNDIKSLSAEVVGDTLTVTLSYAAEVGLTDSNYGSVFIDGDLDPDTGERMGADCILWFCYTGVYSGGQVSLNGSLFTIGEQGTALETGSNFIRFRLPLELWGGNDQPRLFATSSWIFGNTEYDRVPDSGFLDMASDLVVIPRPGNEAVALVYQDPAGDAAFPDLTRLEACITDGNMLIRIGFNHGVEKPDLLAAQDVLVVELRMDLDQRLWTGYANNHEEPPTFGIDRSIQIMLSDLFSVPQGSLRMRKPDDPTTPLDDLDNTLVGIGLGSQETDTRLIVGRNERFGTASNEILISIPLSYLGDDAGAMYLMANAFLEATLDEGHADMLPDSGGLDSSTGLAPDQIVHPVAQCTAAVQTGTDGPDDSLGFGLQGDEIITSRACALDDGGLMLSVDLESLAYDDLAYVNIFVDSDGNAATGMPLYNNTTAPIGAEFYICCRIAAVPDPTIVTGLLVELRSPILNSGIHRIDHLISLRTGGELNAQTAGAHYTLNLPAEILQSVPSSTAAYMITTTQQSFTNENGFMWEDVDGVVQEGLAKDIAFLSPRGAPSLLDTAPDSGFYLVRAPDPRPLAISSITPIRGAPAGGTRVHIFGTSFDRNTTIFIGAAGVAGEDIRFLSSGELFATTPPGSLEIAAVRVENPDSAASAILENAFQYAPPLVAAPRVVSITPDLGQVSGGDSVAISGSNFMAGASVAIGSAAATDIVVQSPFLITATTPAGSLGPADVKVTNSDGRSGMLVDGYNFGSRPPQIWTLFPNFGPLSGGTLLTIVGSGFETGSQVLVGGAPLSGVDVVSDRLITGTTAAGATAGLSDVVVVKPDGVSSTFAGGFDYGGSDPGMPAPVLLGVSPLSSPIAGGQTITISGTNFQNGLALLIDGYPVAIDSFDGSGLITATTLPHASGMVAIDIINPDGRTVGLPVDDAWNSFAYDSNQPSISSIYPSTSPATGGAAVFIYGSNFRPGATVTFGGYPAVIDDISPISIAAHTPPHPPGEVPVTVTNPSGLSATYTDNGIFGPFTYTGTTSPPAPTVTNLSQTQGSVFGGETVTITGANFFTGVRVFFGASEVTAADRISTGTIAITTPAATAGVVDIIIRNADGQEDIRAQGFTYTAPDPTLANVDPATGPVAGGTRVKLSGSGFVADSIVEVAGNVASQVTWLDQNTLMVTMPPGFPGVADVTVRNPGAGSATLAHAFVYEGDSAPAPQIFAIFPAVGSIDGGSVISISGQGFLAGLSVTIGGETVSDVQIHSANSISVTTPPGTAGACDLTITNPDGQSATVAHGFVYIDPDAPAPEIHAITPAQGPTLGGTDVVIRGDYFQPGIAILFNGIALHDAVRISNQEVHGKTPPNPPGSATLKAVNPDDREGELPTGFTYLPSYPAVWVSLSPGYNLIAVHAYGIDVNELLPLIGDDTVVEKVMVYFPEGGAFATLVPDAAGNPSFLLNGTEGLFVYAKTERHFLLDTIVCQDVDLAAGMNLIGIGCPPENYMAFDFINVLGNESVSSIQKYNSVIGSFETASFDENGSAMGVNFKIIPGEGYFVFMKKEMKDFEP